LLIPDTKTIVTLDKTLYIKLNLRNWVDYNIYCLGLYEAPLARFFIRSIKTESIVLDIGVYIGQYTLLAAKYAKEGKVIALEPHPESYNCLKENMSINSLKDVEGHEGFVIRGAQETLTLFRPILIVELSREDEQVFGDTPEMVLDELRKFGYSFLHCMVAK